MDESSSPHRPRPGHDASSGYNRLTTLEVGTAEIPRWPDPDQEHVAIQYCLNIHHQVESVCHALDWDRIFMASFIAISLALILTASLFPILNSDLADNGQFQNQFMLASLTISQFSASPSQINGQCEITLDVSNLGERSLYHENSVISVFLDHELLWVDRTAGFFVEAGDRIVFNVSMNRTTSVSVPASFVPTALLESRERHKPLRFKLKYDGMVREGLDMWQEERVHVYVVCGWIKMQFVGESVMSGGPASCTVENF